MNYLIKSHKYKSYRLSNFIYVLIFFGFNFAFGQDMVFNGAITDKLMQPINNVNLILKNPINQKILHFNTTNSDGVFYINVRSSEKKVIIEFTRLNYKKKVDTIYFNEKKITKNYVLENEALNLKEIVVTQKKVKDTMKINTKNLSLTSRSTLREILEKTDGFNISAEGGISFRGKLINKVLINKKEVFVNQNKIALDNLDYEIMDGVELINNYKEKFDLTFGSNNSSVLNVNTKKEFKGVLKNNIELGGGYKNKYLAKTKSLFFSDIFNAFSINNANSIGKSELGFKDVSFAFNNTTSFLQENLASFFSDDEQLYKSEFINSNLTFRKESKRNKFGLVFYFNNLNLVKKTFVQTNNLDNNLIKKDESSNGNSGNSYATNLNFIRILSSKSLIFLRMNGLFYKKNNISDLLIENFFPNNNSIIESNIQNPKSIYIDFEIKNKNKISDKNILNFGLKNNIENSDQILRSSQIFNGLTLKNQNYQIKKNALSFFSNLERKTSEQTWASIGLKSDFILESLHNKNLKERNYNSTEIIAEFSGKTDSFDFELNLTPKIINFQHVSKLNSFININANLKYNISQNKNINFNFKTENNLIDFQTTIDTLQLSYNNALINNSKTTNVYTISRNFTSNIGYYYSNSIKSKSFENFISFTTNRYFLNSVFDKIENNTFYYSNYLFENNKDLSCYSSISKGYYINKNYDKISYRLNYIFNYLENPTLINSKIEKYFSYVNTLNFRLGFELKNFIFNEINLKTSLANTDINLDKNQVANFKTQNFSVDLIKKIKTFEFNSTIGNTFNKAANNEISIPYFHLYINKTLTNSMNMFVRGKYLFHLFDFPNTEFTSLAIMTNGNLITKNYNNDNINYLIMGLTYKF